MIALPDRFRGKLAENEVLLAAVQRTFSIFEPWLEQSGMPFFPGYTDHSPRHINDVLATASSLISDASHALLSPEDVSVLCMSILLHDCGMHITQDVFRKLVAGKESPVVAELDKLSWARLWEDYLAEAGRFNQDKLVAIFGDSSPLLLDQFDLNNLTERDHYLIGEFLRRHHTRFAHEVARVGVAYGGAAPLRLEGFDHDLADLAGLVARSHGMSIRSTFEYLENHYGNISTCRKVKVPFVMAVLRIADYVQVTSERAIAALLSVKELRSPVSRQEWRNHFAVRDIHRNHDDPEAFFVQARPGDASTFLKLSFLFKDIQRELDESWATLGEVYGRREKLAELGLTVRRIRSNLDSPEKFGKTVNYFPVSARFNSAGPELLKLLVGPLYNYKYQVGIRELMQNAVDACREALDLMNSTGARVSRRTIPRVTVDIKEKRDGTGVVTVTDNGVGMTAETVVNYFLMAGASFRNSDLWKKQHMDAAGDTRVMRGGRFGVGALAGFLLGEEIHVRTRHLTSPENEGVEFCARIDDPVVELRRCVAPAGTIIQVIVTDTDVMDELRPYLYSVKNFNEEIELDGWKDVDWFVQNSPPVVYRWKGFNWKASHAHMYPAPRQICSAHFTPPVNDIVPNSPVEGEGWVSLKHAPGYSGILWRFKPKVSIRLDDGQDFVMQPDDEVIVNGIRIREVPQGREFIKHSALESINEPLFRLLRPTLAIYDPAGICPINLQRDDVSFDRMGVDDDLARSILQEHLTAVRDNTTELLTLTDYKRISDLMIGYRGVNFEGQIAPVCGAANGIFLACPAAFEKLEIDILYFLDLDADDLPDIQLDVLKSNEAIVFRIGAKTGPKANLAWFRGIFSPSTSWKYSYSRNIGAPCITAMVQASIMPKKRWALVNEKKKVSRSILDSLVNVSCSLTHEFVCSGHDYIAVKERALSIINSLPPDSEVAVWAISHVPVEQDSTILSEVWGNVFGTGCWKPEKHLAEAE